MIVDTHVHIWELPPKAAIGPTAPTWQSLPVIPGTAEELLQDMDGSGVDRCVLVQTSWSTWDNGYIADAAKKHRDRFVGQGMIDPLHPDNAAHARYWMDDRGLCGFRFHPAYYHPSEDAKSGKPRPSDMRLAEAGHAGGVDILTAPQNDAMWRVIDERRGFVQVHNRPEDAHQLDAVASRYPRITWLIDHMMYPLPEWAPSYAPYQPVLALARYKNVFIKISDVHGRSKQKYPYRDMHPVVKNIIAAFGMDRCLWGTGYPSDRHRAMVGWPSVADELRLVREGFDFLSDADRANFLGGNAARLWSFQG
ncbi:MAG: amidohydrolase [Dehalococcoidia bacterium]|nr:amidohydrolase [Dehalococcoidia bacterium]MSQ34500.1 amidohydrolase [Dehalococcoidia bacterium]